MNLMAKVIASFGTTKKQRQYDKKLQDTMEMMRLMDEFKMVLFYTLRDMGWGKKRIMRLNKKWNERFIDMSTGWFTLKDIHEVIEKETGLTPSDLIIKKEDL